MSHILVVDDEPAVLDLLAEVLASEGFTTSVAVDGQAALGLLRDGLRPCLVLSDVSMPRVDGWELASTIQREWAADPPPIVLMSAYHPLLAPRPGVVAMLRKPFEHGELVNVLQEQCRASTPP